MGKKAVRPEGKLVMGRRVAGSRPLVLLTP